MADGKTEPIKGVIIDRTEAAVKSYVDNGAKSLSQAMTDVGFSPAYADHPDKLKKTKKWAKLVKKYLPDDTLAQKHNQLLNVGTLTSFAFPPNTPDVEIMTTINNIAGSKFIRISASAHEKRAYFTTINADAQLRALEMAYKITGRINKSNDGAIADPSEEIREVIFRVRKMLPQGGQ